jgi:hypothetical protein
LRSRQIETPNFGSSQIVKQIKYNRKQTRRAERDPESNSRPEQSGKHEEHRQRRQNEPEGCLGMRRDPHDVAGVAPEPHDREHGNEGQRDDQRAQVPAAAAQLPRRSR